VAREAALLAAAGIALALAANALSPRGLNLRRNYFPGAAGDSVAPPLSTSAAPAAGGDKVSAAERALEARILADGFQVAKRAEVAALLQDPRYRQGRVILIDARDEEHYRQGHIPGACELDPYHPERHIASVLPACQAAEEVVVYCNGGDCEDSQFAAVTLSEAGVAKSKLRVYTGGVADWSAAGLPLETGGHPDGGPQGTAE
jgi:rhodanese-related sulfurtransferase